MSDAYIPKGAINEILIVNAINKKKISRLNAHWKPIIKRMFPSAKPSNVVRAFFYQDNLAKTDITVVVGNERANVSIKSGKNPSIHQETFHAFSKFLFKCGISKRTLRILQFYHFGKTEKCSNHGVPFTKDEMMKKYKRFFDEANAELNKPEIVKKVTHRAVIEGANETRGHIDWFYYGSFEDGFLFDIDEIYMNTMRDYDDPKKPLHFGALNYQPNGRDPRKNEHLYVRIKWPLLPVAFYKRELLKLKKEVNK